MNNAIRAFKRFIGFGDNRTSHGEKLISGIGGFTGILLILIVTRQFVDTNSAVLIVASMGASAVLIFAVPHGPLSQPWAVAGGHLVSAVIGVSCYLMVPDLLIAAALSVGLAITAMYYLRCIHPPGGATALTAVVGGSSIHDLGYQYLVTPTLINVAVILFVAVIFNYLFPWRRYPAAMMRATSKTAARIEAQDDQLSRKDLQRALQQMNLTTDVSSEDLEQIYQLAQDRPHGQLETDRITQGHYYSNGGYGSQCSVREVVDISNDPGSDRDQIAYKVVAGNDRGSSGTSSRDKFARWSKYEVVRNENSWQRVTPSTDSAKITGTR